MVQTVQKTFKFSLVQFLHKIFDVFPFRLWLEVDCSFTAQCDTQPSSCSTRKASFVFSCPWLACAFHGHVYQWYFLGLDRARRGSTTGAVVRTVQKPAVRAVLGQGYGRARLTARKLWLLRSCSSSKVVDILVVPLRLISMVQFVRKTIQIPQLQCFDQVVDVPVVRVVQVSQAQVLEDTVVNPQLRSLSNSL